MQDVRLENCESCESELVFKNGDRIGKTDAVCLAIRFAFVRIPLVSHLSSV